MNDDDFGVRWTGYLMAPFSGTYQLGAIGMNAFELYFDGKRLVSFNGIHEVSYQYAPIELQAGKLYQIRLDYHEYVNDASIQLVWSPPPAEHADLTPADAALLTAMASDAIVLVMGLSPRLEGEEMKVPVEGFKGGDRVDLGLPRAQKDLMEKIVALNKPTVLVLMNGSALAVNWARDHVPAIVEAWYPGQAGGDALADVLFGDYNPAGRLPVTFYKSLDQLPAFDDYSMKGRTYRFFTGEPLFPFGYGLSYSTFTYRKLSVPQRASTGDGAKISVEVENTSSRAGEEVVELYVKTPGGRPIRSLEGFRRVFLKPKERKTVEFALAPRQLAHVDSEGRRVSQAGLVEISVGGGQRGSRASIRVDG